jgi:hypothetical protein
MDLTIKREVYQKVNIQLREDHVEFMDRFKQLILESNPEIEAISDHEIYQKAFDFIMTDKRITQKMAKVRGPKRETIADIHMRG